MLVNRITSAVADRMIAQLRAAVQQQVDDANAIPTGSKNKAMISVTQLDSSTMSECDSGLGLSCPMIAPPLLAVSLSQEGLGETCGDMVPPEHEHGKCVPEPIAEPTTANEHPVESADAAQPATSWADASDPMETDGYQRMFIGESDFHKIANQDDKLQVCPVNKSENIFTLPEEALAAKCGDSAEDNTGTRKENAVTAIDNDIDIDKGTTEMLSPAITSHRSLEHRTLPKDEMIVDTSVDRAGRSTDATMSASEAVNRKALASVPLNVDVAE